MFKKIRRLLISGEIELFSKLKKFVSYSQRGIDLLLEMVRYEREHSLDKLILLNEEISSLEKKADEEVLALTNYIMRGSVLPGFRNQFMMLINILDDILDTIHILSREILRFRRYTEIEKIEAIAIIHNRIISQLEHTKNMINVLIRLFDALESDWEEIIEIISYIERLEESGDALKEDTLDSLYIIRDKLPWYVFEYYKNKIFRIDDIQDKCEDASNTLILIIGQITS